ncbi:MAG: hypothetical protein AAF965_06685, partial [Pseudomonadota bacterium]
MRVEQMAQHMRQFERERFDIRVRPISRAGRALSRATLALDPVGSIYFFSKDALRGWTAEDFDALRRRAAAVLVDYVDLKISEGPLWGVDAHIASSFSGARALRDRQKRAAEAGHRVGGEVLTLLHNYDAALTGLRVEQD